MELDHDFTVPVPVDQAWSVLLDVERVAACMPGATLDSIEGEEFKGRMKVKVGAMTITYRGSAHIVSADEPSRTVTMEASAKEARGSGTAAATVQAKLIDEGGTTRVTVHTKLNVTGRPAQFGRNILSEVGSKIISRFAKALEEELESSGTDAPATESTAAEPASEPASEGASVTEITPESAAAPEAPAEPQTAAAPAAKRERPLRVAREDDAIDLLEVAGPSVAKRAVPAVGGLVGLLVVVRLLTRRRRKKKR
ncbi:carbon monoxide dehydrogenase [Actinomadura sp. GC306]|uniref:SRPBCC family protein n=1 Tax=Actinomadura sp. GC306 TaxID=2530367 RepID=UPI00104690D0|nr:SRPBCC family protein [Actinomadura sp. GC306]TDC68871.1 carbon monoxide dehydrogenase [Actinomadura sp. GC306]